MFDLSVSLPDDLVEKLENHVDQEDISRDKLIANLLEKELYKKEVE